MDSFERQWLVARLDGYVRGVAEIDQAFNDSNVGAYIAPLDEHALLESLRSHLQQEPAHQYLYDTISKIQKPWTRKLDVAIEGFLLQAPFGMVNVSSNVQLKRARGNIVWGIMDMIGMATNDFSCDDIFCVEVRSNDGYSGHFYLFPLDEVFLILKMISRASS